MNFGAEIDATLETYVGFRGEGCSGLSHRQMLGPLL